MAGNPINLDDALYRVAKQVIKQMERVERDELSLRHAAAEMSMIPSEFTSVYVASRWLLHKKEKDLT